MDAYRNCNSAGSADGCHLIMEAGVSAVVKCVKSVYLASYSSCSIVFCCILQLLHMKNGAFYRDGLLSVVSSGKHLAELSQL